MNREMRSGLAWAEWTGLGCISHFAAVRGVWFGRDVKSGREGAIPDCYTVLCSWTGWGRRDTIEEVMRKGKIYRMEKWGEIFPLL